MAVSPTVSCHVAVSWPLLDGFTSLLQAAHNQPLTDDVCEGEGGQSLDQGDPPPSGDGAISVSTPDAN